MQKAEKMQALREFAAEIRVETLKTIGSLGFGHVGGSMSIADAMAVLYGCLLYTSFLADAQEQPAKRPHIAQQIQKE